MASTIESQSSQQYVDFDEYIDYQLQKTRGNIKSIDILTAFAFVAVFVLAYLLLFVICDHWLVADGFARSTRVVLLSAVGLFSAAWLGWKVVWPYLRQVNHLFAAKVIEQSQPELRSTLLNLIDARTAGKAVSPEILTAMEKRAAISMSHTNVDDAVDRRPLMWACYAVLGLVVVFSLYTIFTPKKVSASIWRALFPASIVEAPTQTVIETVTPGDVEIIPGTRLEVLADLSGELPETITLHYSTADSEFVDEPIEMRKVPDMPRRYRAEMIGTNGEGIQQDLNYYITAGDDQSERYTVTVFQPPSAEIVKLHFDYPAYMEKESKSRPREDNQAAVADQPKPKPSGHIDDYEGVNVTFIAESNMPLKSATITFQDDQGTNYRAESIPMSPMNAERTRFRANWVLSIRVEDGIYPRYYSIACKNERGESDPKPTAWPIRIHPDQRPKVQITHPRESEVERPANAILPLSTSASDDFKVKSLTLWKQLNDQPPVQHATMFQGAEASLGVDYNWRLNAGWSLKVRDKVSYWVQAQDNRTPHAGRRNTDKYTVIIQPEQPEDAVQEQLQSERQSQKQDPDKADNSEKNPDQKPNKNTKPQDNGTDDKNPDPNTKPMPQEGQPQDNQKGEEGKNPDGAEGQNEEGANGNADSKPNGDGGQSVKNDGSEDGKALESLHRHLSDDKNQPGQQENSQGSENNSLPSKTDTGEQPKNTQNDKPSESNPEGKPGEKPQQQPNDNKPDPNNPDNSQQPNQKPGNADQPKPGEDPAQKSPQETETGTEKKNDDTPMPNGTENSKKPAENPDPNNPQNPAGTNNKPGEKNTGNADSNNQPGQQNPGGTDQKPGEGNPSKSTNPAKPTDDKGTGGEQNKPGEKGAGPTKEKPEGGTETPGDPDKNAEKKPATGEEKGPATAEEDPNAKAKPAKNNLDRKDPEKPTTTQKREGEPNALPKDQKPAENPDPANNKPGSKKPGSKNSEDVKPNPSQKPAQPDTNPDQRPESDPATNPDRKPANTKPANTEDQPNTGDDKLKGEGRPEGQQAKKPDGGEGGTSKQNEKGTPGGTEKGPGDNTPRPGDKDPSQKPNQGKPNQEPGEGSQTRPTERTEEGQPQKANSPENADPKQSPNPQKPGEDAAQPGSQGTPQQPGGSEKPNPRTNQPGGPNINQTGDTKQPITPDAARAAEQQNLEYGQQATDLALKRLEKELQRGEVNEQWLKDMGWDKADASQFLDRMKDRLGQRNQDTPESLAKQRQFQEWMKRLSKPAAKTTQRSGSTVRNEAAREIFNAPKTTAPPELRDLYEAYQRGISEGTK